MLIFGPEKAGILMSNPMPIDLYNDLLELLKFSRSPYIYVPNELFEFQLVIINRIKQTEEKLKDLNDKNSTQAILYKHLRRIYKWIMDGIALRLLSFDQNVYAVLSDNKNPGNLEKEGFIREIKTLENLKNINELALLNGLTNFIRFGDLTIFRKNSIELIEVKKAKSKSKKNKNRLSDQEKKMKEAERMVNQQIVSYCGKENSVIGMNLNAQTYLNRIRLLLERSKKTGSIIDCINDSVQILVINTDALVRNKIDIFYLYENFGLLTKTKNILYLSSVDLFFDKDGEIIRSSFPPSILKLPCKSVLDLMAAKSVITVKVNLGKIKEILENEGFSIYISEFREINDETTIDKRFNNLIMPLQSNLNLKPWIVVKKDNWTMKVAGSLFAKIGFEFLHPNSVINYIKYNYNLRGKLPLREDIIHTFTNHRSLYR